VLDHQRKSLVEVVAMGRDDREELANRPAWELESNQGLVGHCATTGKASLVNDVSQDPRYFPGRSDIKSELTVPISIEDRVFAVIDCEEPEADYFTPEHLELLALVASMTATKIANLRDIERLGQTTDQLTEVESYLERTRSFVGDIIETAPNILYVLDYRRKLMVEGMDKFAAFLGYEVAEIEAMPEGVYSLLHPDDQGIVDDQERRQAANPDNQTIVAEFRLHHKSGEWKHCLVSSKIFERDANGIPIMGVCSVQDVSRLKAVEQTLHGRDQRLRRLFGNCFDCIVLYDGEGNCQFSKPSVERFTGYTDTEVVGKNALDLVVEEDHQHAIEVWNDLLKRPVPVPSSSNACATRMAVACGSRHV